MSAPPPTATAPTTPAPLRRPLAWASDERLAELTRDGDERAFGVIVERHRPQLLAHARRIAGERAAEDALQHALVCAWHALRRKRDVRHVRAWLFKIVHRSALQTLRERRDVAIELVDAIHPQALSVEEQFERSMGARAALAALAALPLREREALVATSVEGRSASDVARELGIADGALRQLVFRARSRARAAAGAFTPPVLVPRLRAFAGGWHRRGHALASHASASIPPIPGPVAVGSAIVLAAAGAQVAGVPLIPGAHDPAHVSSEALRRSSGTSPQQRGAARAISRAHGGAARALVRVPRPAPGTSTAPVGSEPPGRSAAPSALRSPTDLRSSSGATARSHAGALGPASVLLGSPAAPSLRSFQASAGGAGGMPEAAAGSVAAVAGVAGAAGEATRTASHTVAGVVTTVAEPVARGVETTVESVTPHAR